jgi:hypothetical protein
VSERLNPPDTTRFRPLDGAHLRQLPEGMLVGRIHCQGGAYPDRWNEFRNFGPTTSRFDHPPPPAGFHRDRGVLYVAPRINGKGPVLRTCIAECFRDRGNVELTRDAPHFVLFRLARPVRLLDLTYSDWVSLADGNAAISSDPRDVCRDWARTIREHYRGADAVDGMFYTCSNIPSERTAVLWERATSAVPAKPALHLPLTSADLRAELEMYTNDLHLGLIP